MSQAANFLAIDLGTSKVRLANLERGVFFEQPVKLALDEKNQKILGYGFEAEKMQTRVGQNIVVKSPFNNGVLSQPKLLTAFLKLVLTRVFVKSPFARPVVAVSVPQFAHEAESRALTELLEELGAREVIVITQPLAAGLGAGVAIAEASGSCLLQLGASSAQAALISLSGVVAKKTSYLGGQALVERLQFELKNKNKILIDLKTSEQIIEDLEVLGAKETSILVPGKSLVTGAPQEVTVSNQQLVPLVKYFADEYYHLLEELLAKVPSSLSSDVIDKGVLLSGGLAQLSGLDNYLTQKLGVAVLCVEDPELAVVNGLRQVLKNLPLFKESIGYKL